MTRIDSGIILVVYGFNYLQYGVRAAIFGIAICGGLILVEEVYKFLKRK